ncbi:MAG TPA: phosphoribosylformylglycinamidine synthase subunit PurL [Gemmatimonadetes bacterium]|nr:phosphoribosylformylglycinamidine synthase subunit PurL [Gemmatimonadota bacterium]
MSPQSRPGDPQITPELVSEHGLSPSEYQKIREILTREPSFTELGVFSAMWSEHCGYKNSKRMLKLLPTKAPWVIQGPGENAGVIDIGDDLALVFKIESHNHPSAVEPYQGAATGVGGILRDIFTMGARPIAILDSLRFGDLNSGRVRFLFSGVVQGVGDYGNCVGIPNIGGEVFFDKGYEDNPIVNAMCLGLMKRDSLIKGEAEGVGNLLVAVGTATGRDGIHGATFASEELSEDSQSSRPQVQVGDPFTEKLLLEASLELIHSGYITGIQDMGAAGITSSAAEMGGRSGNGVEINIDLVPVREPNMTPYEILLSESQERMLVVVKTGHLKKIQDILTKWELKADEIGCVTDDGLFRVTEGSRTVAAIPCLALTEGCPTYEREGKESSEIKNLRSKDLSHLKTRSSGYEEIFLDLLGSGNICSKRWLYQQYDTTVRTNTVIPPGADAGVIRLRENNKAIAATTDCNGRYVYLNPRMGTKAAVAEAARNLVSVGALPMAVTNNLNFGNPLKPEIYYQFREAVLGMSEACKLFETPVTGGNVSFYNETSGTPIYPTPVIGMVGIIDDTKYLTRPFFQESGDVILLLGNNTDELGGSEYIYVSEGLVAGEPPAVDLLAERQLQHSVLSMINQELLQSAHDLSEGGLACALAESALGNKTDPFGVDIILQDRLEPIPLFFGEAQGRILVSCAKNSSNQVLQTAKDHGVPCRLIGEVVPASNGFRIAGRTGNMELDIETMSNRFFNAIPTLMDKRKES